MNSMLYKAVTGCLEKMYSGGLFQGSSYFFICFLMIISTLTIGAGECPELTIEYAIDAKWGVVEFYGWQENKSMEENTEMTIQDKDGANVGYKWYGNNLLWIDWQDRDDAYDIIIKYINDFEDCGTDTIYGIWYPFFDVEITVDSGSGTRGQLTCLPVTAKNFLSISQFEFYYSWSIDSLNFFNIDNINPLLEGALDIEVSKDDEGRQKLSIERNISWKDTVTIDEDDILFEMCFKPIICGPAEIIIQAVKGIGSPGFEVAGIPVIGESNSAKINLEDESNFDFELTQLCTSTDPDLFDFQLKIVNGSAPYTYTFSELEKNTGSFWGPDTNLFEIPVGNYTITVETQCVERSRTLSLRSGEGIPEVNFHVKIDTIQLPNCENQFGGELIVQAEPVSSEYSYFWVEGNMDFENGHISGLPEGLHTIEVRDSLNCKQTKEISFSLTDDILIDWAYDDTKLCPDQESAKVELFSSVSNFLLSIDGGVMLSGPEYVELAEGDHNISVKTEAGCQIDTIISITQVDTYDSGVDLLEEIKVFEGDSVMINITEPPNGSSIIWTSSGKEIGNESLLHWLPSTPDDLFLEVIYPPGCEYKKSMKVEILKRPEFSKNLLPNAFSPNGDMINDVLKIPISELGIIDEVLQLDIFDRYGSLVYSKQNQDIINSEEISWNGIIDDQPAASNVYLAQAVFRLSDGTHQSVRWNVHLIR